MTYTATSVKSAFTPDFNASKTFFKALGKTEICFRLIPDVEKDNPESQKAKAHLKAFSLSGTFDQHCNVLSKKNREGYGIFAVINDGGHDAKSINKIRAVFVDFDTPDQPRPDYAIEPSIVVRTSLGKHHGYWLTDDVKVDQFQPLQRQLIDLYKTDPPVNDLPRVMRVPGFYHVKNDPQLVTLEVNSDRRYVMSDIEKLCSIPVSENLEHSIAETTVNSDPEITVNPSLAAYVKRIVDSPDSEINDTVFKISYEMGLAKIEAIEFDRAIATALMMRGREGDQHHLETAFRGYNNGFEAALKTAKRSVREFHLEVIEKTVRGHLKRDEYGMNVYYRGVETNDISLLYLQLSNETGLTLQKQYTQDKLELLLELPEYQSNMLRDKLLQYASQYNDESIMDEIPNRMGITSEIQKVMIKKSYIRLAARTLYPGCKADEVLILQGKPGCGKTEYFVNKLGDRRYYAELNPNESDKDERMKINRVAIGDMNEIENTFTKKDIGALKAFITNRDDTFRLPYGRKIVSYPRHCVLVGTANSSELLRDPTGNRRYQIVEVGQIDLKWFDDNDPKILGYCVNLVKNTLESAGIDPQETVNYPELSLWWLSPDEQIAMKENDKQFESKDDIEEAVINAAIHLGSSFTATQLLLSLSGLEIQLKDRAMMGRVNTILEKNQYKKSKRGGVKTYHWYAPETASDEPETVSDVALEASTNEPDDTCCMYVPMDQIQVGDEVTDQQTRQLLRVIEINGDTIKLGGLNDGLPFATRDRSDCVDARRTISMVDF